MSNNTSLATNIDSEAGYILLFRLIVWGYAGMVISIFGIAGNVVTILVLISPSMRTTSTNMYLTALSGSNIFFLLIFIPSYSMRYLLGYRLYMTNQPPFAFEILLTRLPTTPVYNTILLSLIYLTIAVSVDRLIFIQFPLKAPRILTKRTTLLTIMSIYIFSITYCIPYWLEQRYVPEDKICVMTPIGKKIHKYTRIYIYIPVVYLIPFVTLTCINITIIQNMLAQNRRKQSLGTQRKKKSADHHITLMLVTVIIVFVLCQLPLLILNAWFAIDPDGSYASVTFHILNSIGILLMVCNTSTNFLLYCFFGQKFRKTLLQLFSRVSSNQHKQSLTSDIDKRRQSGGKQKHRQQSIATRSSIASRESKLNGLNNKHDYLSTSISYPMEKTITTTSNMIKEESYPLIQTPTTEALSTVVPNTDVQHQQLLVRTKSIKEPQNEPDTYTCSNGKQILTLKI